MQPLQLLTLLRQIGNDTITACNLKEYKPGFIYGIHNKKLESINNRIKFDGNFNRAVKIKYFAEVRKMILPPARIKDYGLIEKDIKNRLTTLQSAIDFMKR